MRCVHDPIQLYDSPPKGDVNAYLGFALQNTHRWMICRKCGETGYWGGHGHKRRIRWGYGGEDLLVRAEEYNRSIRAA